LSWKRRGLHGALALIALLLLGEIAARVWLWDVPDPGGRPVDLAERFRRGHPGEVDARGYRNPDAADTASDGAFRIAVTGDAFAWGRGVEISERFGERLAGHLGRLGHPTRVRSFALPGASDDEQLEILRRDVLPGGFDLVLLQWAPDDLGGRPGVGGASWLAAHSALAFVLERARLEVERRLGHLKAWRTERARHMADPEDPAARAALDGLFARVAAARAAGMPVGVVLTPVLEGRILVDDPDLALHDRVLARCRAEGVPCVDLRPVFALAGVDRLRIHPLDPGPGTLAHALAATALLQGLADELGVLPNATAPIESRVERFGTFEVRVRNARAYANPFADVSLLGAFRSPSGRMLSYFGFHDGPADPDGAAPGGIWVQRFMPDEVGVWSYWLGFDDGTPARAGRFECLDGGARPGPWRQDPDNPRWLRSARGGPLTPTAFFANAVFTPLDWRQAIAWARARGFDTLVTPTLNAKLWGEGWENPTPFAAVDTRARQVDYTRYNLRAWREWDAMLAEAGDAGLHVGPFEGPAGDYGGQSGQGTVVPPKGLEYGPRRRMSFDDPRNLRIIRYLVARQGAFGSLAYWNLYSTEIHEIMGREEVRGYIRYLAALTPFGRMITGQDLEQRGRRWLSEAPIPSERKLNTLQMGDIDDERTQAAAACNADALEAYHGFPVFATEALWEGQARANRPLRMIWGSLSAGIHMMWADWSYDDGVDGGRWGSMGRGWTPLRPLSEPVFGLDQLGADTRGDEWLPIATATLSSFDLTRMIPRNDLVAGGAEAYCLAEAGAQYLVYLPDGGTLRLDREAIRGRLEARWMDPRTGERGPVFELSAGDPASIRAPDRSDAVLIVRRP